MAPEALTPAEFFWHAVKSERKSREENRPIFDKKEFIRFFMPGGHPWAREVQEKDRNERPAQYEKFKAEEEQVCDGTPVDQWPFLDVAQIAELKHLHIYTVEQLANYPAANASILGMGGKSLQLKA